MEKSKLIGYWRNPAFRHLKAPLPRDKAAAILRAARESGAPVFRTPEGFSVFYRAKPRGTVTEPVYMMEYV